MTNIEILKKFILGVVPTSNYEHVENLFNGMIKEPQEIARALSYQSSQYFDPMSGKEKAAFVNGVIYGISLLNAMNLDSEIVKDLEKAIEDRNKEQDKNVINMFAFNRGAVHE